MAQVVVKLPDSAVPPPTAASLASTDDLLSQLAGNEIDRLLAEADLDSPPHRDASPSVSKQLDDLLSEATSPTRSQAAPATPAQLTNPPSPEGEERTALLEAAGFAPQDSAEANSSAETPGDERSALLAAAGFQSDAEDVKPLDSLDDEADTDIPLLLKPLAWLNAPFDSLSVTMRMILGRVAIVTLVNAAAVLAYVLVFRKH